MPSPSRLIQPLAMTQQERDRMALECQFNEIEAEKYLLRLKRAGQESTRYGLCSADERRSYHQFRQKIRHMQNEDLLSLPSILWKEDIPLGDSPRSDHYQNHRKNNSNNRRYRNDNNSIITKLDEGFQTSVREHRGTGLALLIADTDCRNALIGHCYTRFYMNQQREEKEEASCEPEKPTMRVEGAVTMIHGGGKYLRYCGLIGHTTLSTDDEDDQNNAKPALKAFNTGKVVLNSNILCSNLQYGTHTAFSEMIPKRMGRRRVADDLL